MTGARSSDNSVWPLRWGVDDAGGPARLDTVRWAADAFEELGFDLWVMHYQPEHRVAANAEMMRTVDAWAEAHGITWICNVEHANWIAKHIDDRGRDWHNRPDGRHYFLFPDELLQELGRCRSLGGLMYDEAAHMQNCRNQMAEGISQPWIYDPTGHRLEDAAEGFVDAVSQVAAQHARYGLKLYTEHVFPVLFHAFARSGFVAATKVLKENWSPAYIACAMGAAKQYGTELWITPDLWGLGGYPDHSVEEYRSALLLAYHMGADCIYTENLAYDHEQRGQGSLLRAAQHAYIVTPYGEVTRWFRHEYVPAHPRRYSFRELEPRVAIVRQPDACWGQGTSWLPDTLYGSPAWPSNNVTEGWLRIWHLLTRGVIGADSLSWHADGYKGRPYQVFCPMDGVVVYDHTVSEELLKGVEVIFLTGLGVSANTLAGIQRRVSAGATCIGLPHLLPEHVVSATGRNGAWREGAGTWVATEDFLGPHVRKQVQSVLPAYDAIRYRFGDTTVTFRPVDGDPNRLSVDVS